MWTLSVETTLAYNLYFSVCSCARAGENGPVVTVLLNPDIPLAGPGIDIDGRAIRDSFTNKGINNVTCSDGRVVNNVASLYDAVLANLVYVNVHSEANVGGEVRGQVFP